MKYRFEQFEFDKETQILTKEGTEIALHEKASRLLALFLRDPKKLYTKSDILDEVWSDKVVSDQVVFQNISHLRVLFGNQAIKTYIKKGYQWQLPILEVNEDVTLSAVNNSRTLDNKINTGDTLTSNNKLFILISLLLMMLFIKLYIGFDAESELHPQHRTITMLEPDTPTTSTDSFSSLLANSALFNFQNSDLPLTNQQVFDSPYSAWSKSVNTDSGWLTATKTYTYSKGKLLRFHIQGQNRGWQGYLTEADENAQADLIQLISALNNTEYFELSSDNAALAELTLLQAKYPKNLLINMQLIRLHLQLGNFDLAIALVDSQLTLSHQPAYLGIFYLLKAQGMMENENWPATKTNILLAIETFNQLGLPQLESLALLEFAWVNYVEKDIAASIRTLNLAANKAREVMEPLQELKAHLLQAYLASKVKQLGVMNAQIDMANNLITLHNLEVQHRLPIYSTLAWSAKDKQQALPHYMALLSQPYAPLYKDRLYNAARHVREINIEKENWQAALGSIRQWQRPSFVTLTKAHVAFAQNDVKYGTEFAISAFRQAQVDHYILDALNAAFLLLQQQHKMPSFNDKEYKDYIAQNATHSWYNQNKELLNSLKIM